MMKCAVVVAFLLLGAGTVWAEDIKVASLFTWASGPTPDWARGALYAALGMVGALI